MQWLDGKKCALDVQKKLAQEVDKLKLKGVTPLLKVFLVGDDPASQVYVRNKTKVADCIGVVTETVLFSAGIQEEDLIKEIKQANRDERVHGILVQMPLPDNMDVRKVINAIDPSKDVDGFHPLNVGRLVLNEEGMLPCTPAGIMKLLEMNHISLAGKHIVVLGRSHIVGKPMAQLALNADATVTSCHSKTKALDSLTQQADVLIVAIGKAHFVTPDMVKEGAVVIDVGMNRCEGKLYGDVHPDVANKASAMTPVPGGVGPMTITMLMQQTLKAAERMQG